MKALIILSVLLSATMSFAQKHEQGKKVSKPAQQAKAAKPARKQTMTVANSATCNKASINQEIMLKSNTAYTHDKSTQDKTKVADRRSNIDG